MATEQDFLNQLWQGWKKNMPASILVARLNHGQIPRDVVTIAQRTLGAFQAQKGINDAVAIGLGSLGIGAGPARSSGIDPEQFMFYSAMALIVQHKGNPPATPGLAANAGRILRGELDPIQAHQLSAADAGFGGLWQMVASLANEFSPMLRGLGLYSAALAVPWNEIPGLLGIPPETPEEAFKVSMKKVMEAMKAHDTKALEQSLLAAFDVAEQTPAVDDDIQAISLVAILGTLNQLTAGSLRRAVTQLAKIDVRKRADKLHAPVSLLVSEIESFELTSELGPTLLGTMRQLLEVTTGKVRVSLLTATARLLLNLQDLPAARPVVAEAQRLATIPNDVLWVAELRSHILRADGNDDGAATVLASALEANSSAEADVQVLFIRKLINIWPQKRSGLDQWLQHLKATAATLKEPQGSIERMKTALVLFEAVRIPEGRVVTNGLNLDQLATHNLEVVRKLLKEVRSKLNPPLSRGAGANQ